MIKNKIRGLEEMPSEVKLQYFKVLFAMARIDGKLNQLEAMELYRLMSKVKLQQKERLHLLDTIEGNSEEIINISKTIMEDFEDQERNILRFSLMKDLIIIMSADYHQSPEEKELFSKIKVILQITEEQLEFFQDEYEKDKIFIDEDCTHSICSQRLEKRILTATAIGIPVGALYIKKKETKKCYCFFYRDRIELSGMDVLKAISLGFISYQGLKWLFRIKTNKEEILNKYLHKECLRIQERAIRYLITDRSYFEQKLVYTKEETNEIASTNSKRILLDKTYAILKNSKPSLL